MASVKDFSVEEKLVNLYKLQTVDSSIDQIKILYFTFNSTFKFRINTHVSIF